VTPKTANPGDEILKHMYPLYIHWNPYDCAIAKEIRIRSNIHSKYDRPMLH
jgi:hypothetical protein